MPERALTPDEELIYADSPAVPTPETDDEQRLERIEAEFRTGFETLAGLGTAVCVFARRAPRPATSSTRRRARPAGRWPRRGSW